MKKLYTTAMLAAAAISASAATADILMADRTTVAAFNRPDFETTLAETVRNRPVTLAEALNTERPSRKAPMRTVPEGEWKSLGEGTWHEGLFTLFSDVPAGLSWSVEIEESETAPGYYRMQPYTEGSTLAELIGATDDGYVYVNATDPTKVYIDGDLELFQVFVFSHMTPENEWDYEEYGTMTDGVIEFPANSFGFLDQGGWERCNSDGDFRIAMPGVTVKDYSVSLYSPMCAENNNVTVQFTRRGADVADLKVAYLPGLYHIGGNENLVATKGTSIGKEYSGLKVPLKATDNGIFTLLAITLDADGNVRKGAETHFFAINEPADDWALLEDKTAILTEGIFPSVFNDVYTETIECDVEQCISQKGRYRLVDPYKKHSVLGDLALDHSSHHSHYVYLNATDPQYAYLEASPTGISLGNYGESYIWSWADYFASSGMEAEAKEYGFYGTFVDGKFTITDGNLILGHEGLESGSPYYAGIGFSIQLKDKASAIAPEAADSDSQAEYYNLQGMRVDRPAAGLYIRRCGGKTTKVIR